MSIKLIDDIKGNFIATGVGSLPFLDTQEAVNFVFDVLGQHIPYWPQLPKRTFCENMYVQFSEGLPGIKIDEKEKAVWVDTSCEQYLSSLEESFNKIEATDVDFFSVGRQYAEGLYAISERMMELNWEGWAKAQVIGPISLGLTLFDEKKNPIIYNAELRELIPSLLSLKAAWIGKQLKVNSKTKIMIFLDEPYLVAVGTNQCSLDSKVIIENINRVVSVIHEAGALAGLHCCGNTDWNMLMQTNIDILNFDAYGYLDKLLLYDKALNAFLKRGGILAPGVVPSNTDVAQEGLADRLFNILKSNPVLFKNGMIVTPSCGCSGLSPQLAKKAALMCVELAERMKVEF